MCAKSPQLFGLYKKLSSLVEIVQTDQEFEIFAYRERPIFIFELL